MVVKKYSKEDIKLLLTVSATTFAIFVSLGLALPVILAKGTELEANLFANSLWLIGVGINLLVVLSLLFTFAFKKADKPHDTLTSVAFLLVFVSYFVVFIALIFFTQIILHSPT